VDYNKIPIGQFECVSGKFAISDPCYETDVWCRGELDNIKIGTWNADIGTCDIKDWGTRVGLLIATHESFDEDAEGDLTEHTAQFEVGVDSGQAGIFDAQYYRDDSIVPVVKASKSDFDDIKAGSRWYGLCCGATDQEHHAGVIPYGVVSSSGYGDGGYDCVYYTDTSDQVVKVVITFIGDDKNEDV